MPADHTATDLFAPVAPAPAAISVGVLGHVAVSGAGGRFTPAGSRPGAVLAALTLHVGECVSSDRLVDWLWGSEPTATSGKRVQVNLLRLRRALAQIAPGLDPALLVRTHAHAYALEIDPGCIDAVRFARLVARGRARLDAGDAAQARAACSEALALWRGEPYGDYAYEPFVAADIRRLDDLRELALETWAEAELQLGAHATLTGELQRLVERHPLRERLYALLMVALYRCRRQGEALATYQQARRALVDGLGIEPGPELRELQRSILEQCGTLQLGSDHARNLVAGPLRMAQLA